MAGSVVTNAFNSSPPVHTQLAETNFGEVANLVVTYAALNVPDFINYVQPSYIKA